MRALRFIKGYFPLARRDNDAINLNAFHASKSFRSSLCKYQQGKIDFVMKTNQFFFALLHDY